MKIAFLTAGIFPSKLGGMQKHSYNLVKHLAQLKIEIDLYYFVPTGSKDSHLFSEEELQYISFIKIEYPKIPKIPGQYFLQEYFYSKRVYNALKKRPKVNFIYSQGFTAWRFQIKKLHTPLGVNLHGFEMFQMSSAKIENLKKKLLQIPAKVCTQKANFVFSFGAKFNSLLKEINIPNAKQNTFFNGISESWIRKEVTKFNQTRVFLFVGRYEVRKGIDILNLVLQKLIEEDYDFKFIFIGPIPKEKQIIDKRIKYTGPIYDEEKIKEYYQAADVYVLPSLSEGMPTVILEAMARAYQLLLLMLGRYLIW